jgi:hypothetical protein
MATETTNQNDNQNARKPVQDAPDATMPLLVVLLDHAVIGSGPGTVVAHVRDTAEYIRITRPDGVRNPRLRLWRGNFPVGARVKSRLICGTGQGITEPI